MLLGQPGASDDDLVAALREANAWEFVSQLPEQLDTQVGQTGVQLSGGQKQRIAIARALVRDPKILLLDEATSALDMASEAQVQAALDEATLGGRGRTIVVVAHRLSTVLKADMIAVIKDGQVAEIGTHAELMAKGGLYLGLVNSQLNGRGGMPDKQPQHDSSSAEEETTLDIHKHHNLDTENVNKVPEDEEKEESAQSNKDGFRRLLAANGPEWPYILVGVVASVAMGGAMALFSILFGAVARTVSYEDLEVAREEAVTYAIMFGMLGVGCVILMTLQGLMFGISGLEPGFTFLVFCVGKCEIQYTVINYLVQS
jgi:ATP-binding cassette subfamily B (MDR/TAP) protein 1